jgi:hypothetical protein
MAADHVVALAQAISALYGGHGDAQQQANQWLNSFSHQPQAWEACLELLDPGRDAEVCFFCANMLLTKARKDWHKVPAEQQARMAALIRCAARAPSLHCCSAQMRDACQLCGTAVLRTLPLS